uniref:Putative hydroxymethylglutaryl-CoA lyase n=1 Tax=mine drainage metagenome TaxID=410659 RepID=E6QL74_9ZZZZ
MEWMEQQVKIIECPRDAWQGLPLLIPSEVKAAYLRRLIDAGVKHLDAVSFVSPKAVPQMADSERVLELLDVPVGVEVIGIVVNEKGAERAICTGAVETLGFPYSISSEFLRRNQNQTIEESIEMLESIGNRAREAGLGLVAYISMAFGNPYEKPWSIDEVVSACDLLAGSGVTQISLADTVGLASPRQIEETVDAVLSLDRGVEIGVHLHARRGKAAKHIEAAFRAGCRRFDSALGGLGGCPFAQDDLVGNLPTETLIDVLTRCGASLPEIVGLNQISLHNREIAARYGTGNAPVSRG